MLGHVVALATSDGGGAGGGGKGGGGFNGGGGGRGGGIGGGIGGLGGLSCGYTGVKGDTMTPLTVAVPTGIGYADA